MLKKHEFHVVSSVQSTVRGQADLHLDGVSVDARADVHPTARLGADCTIGPFAVVGANVELGAGCVLHSHAVVQGPSRFGPQNEIHPFACIGGSPQDRRYKGEPTLLDVGARNIFREHVTVSRGTIHGGGVTKIGDNNLIMAYSHVAHDCILGDNIVMANHATLAGHTEVQNFAVFGGMVAVGTFLRIGESAMLAAGSMVEREIPPFCTVAGDRARLRVVNRVGLERREFSPLAMSQIKEIFKDLKSKKLSIDEIVTLRSSVSALTEEAARMIAFLRTVKRGLVR